MNYMLTRRLDLHLCSKELRKLPLAPTPHTLESECMTRALSHKGRGLVPRAY